MRHLRVFVAAGLAVGALASAPAPAADADSGRELYEIHCESCHGFDGRSPDPTIPDLSAGDTSFRLDVELLDMIRDGSANKPAFRGLLSDNEIRSIISYLRTF